RNSAIRGCCSSTVLTNSMIPVPLVDEQPAAAELPAHALGQFDIGGLDVLQRVFEAELLPLAAAHLVEAQDLHALDRLEPGADIGHLLDVVEPVAEARHEHETGPHP